MKKELKYYLSPDRLSLCMSVEINGVPCGTCFRALIEPYLVTDWLKIQDVTTHDLILHAFMRLSHQYIVMPQTLEGSEKIEEMFEMENPNI